MRIVRGLAALLVLLAALVATPVLLVRLGEMARPRQLADPAAWFSPDDGSLLLTLVWLVAWAAWALFVLSTLLELPRLSAPADGRGAARGALAGMPGGSGRSVLVRPRSVVSVLLLAIVGLVPAVAMPVSPAQAAPSTPVDDAAPATPVAGPRAGPTQLAHVQHRVERGESLWSISEKFYDDGSQWRRIADANPALADPDALEMGQVLRIPGVHQMGEPAPIIPLGPAETPAAGSPPEVSESESGSDQPLPPGADQPTPPQEPAPPQQPGPPRESAPPQEPGSGEDDTRPRALPLPAGDQEPAQPTEPAEPSQSDEPQPDQAQSDQAQPDQSQQWAELGTVAILGAQLGMLAATGLTTLLRRRREVQLAMRPVGERITHASTPMEADLGALSDPATLASLDQVLRAAGAHLAPDVPGLQTVVVTDDVIRIRFARAPGPPPVWARPGTSTESGGSLEWVVARHGPVPDAAAWCPWPALVSVGTGLGGEVLWDLETAGTTVLRGARQLRTEFLTGMVLDIAASPWSADLDVWVLGDQPTLELTEVAHARTVTPLELRQLARLGSEQPSPERRRELRARGIDEDHPARILITGERLDDQTRAELLPAAERLGLAVVTVDEVGAGIVLNAPPEPSLLPDGTAVLARAVTSQAAEALANVFRATSGESTDPAWWWQQHAVPLEELPANVTRIHPDRTRPNQPVLESAEVNTVVESPRVKLLGPIELTGAAGVEPTRARRTCIEYAAWLLENPGATARQMARELMVAESTRRSNMSRLRRWLGHDEQGQTYLPEAYTGRIALDPAVSSDWQELQLMVIGGINRTTTEGLRAALELVRGAPLADAAPTQWHWAEVLRTDAISVIRDIGIELARRALHAGDLDLARWATAQSLVVSGEDEQLLCMRIRVEVHAGNLAEVPRLAMRLTRHARVLNVDLSDETIALLQQVMEGRLRSAGNHSR